MSGFFVPQDVAARARSAVERTNPDIVDWPDLTEDRREVDRIFVRALPPVLRGRRLPDRAHATLLDAARPCPAPASTVRTVRSGGVGGGVRPRGAAGAGRTGRRLRMIVVAVIGLAVAAAAVRALRQRQATEPDALPPVVRDEGPAPADAPASPWFDAPVPYDTPTPPMGIPTSAPDRLPGALRPDPAARTAAGPTRGPAPGPARTATPPPGATEITDPGLRLPPVGSGAPYPSSASGGRASVATLAPAGPIPGFTPWPEAVQDAPPAAPAHRWGLGAYLLAQAVFLLVSVLLGAFLVGDGPLSVGVLAVAIAVPGLVAAGVAVVITLVRGNGPFVDFGLRWSWRELGIGLAFGFGGLFISLPAAAVYVGVVGEDASSAVGDIFGDLTATPAEALLIASLVVLVVPLCEEILFRGLLWGGLTRLGANVWVAFAVTTVIFALAHFEWPRAILLLAVALPIGLARIYGDGLLAPIVAHQANNLLPGIGLYLMLTGAFPAL